MKVYPWTPKTPTSVFAPHLKAMRMCRDEPQSVADIARLTGISFGTLRHMLPNLRAVGLIGVKAWARNGRAKIALYGWGADEVEDAPVKAKPKATCIALASIWRALHERMTVADLADETGLSRGTLQAVLAVAKAHRLAYVAEWRKVGKAHTLAPVWRLGSQSNTPRPQPVSRKEINAKHWQQRAAKRDHLRLMRAISAPLQKAA